VGSIGQLSMQKIIIREAGGPDVLKLIECEEPVAHDGEVVVRVHAASVAWPDVLIRRGVYNWMPPLPCTPGNDMAGIVESVGASVSNVRVGQRVYLTARELPFRGGGYTEKIAVPAAAVRILPDAIDADAAIALGYYSLAWALLHEATQGFRPETLLVVGAAGGVGSALVQLASLLGIEVIGTVGTEEKAHFVKRQGAAHTINYRTESSIAERALALTRGRGVDMVVDHVGGPQLNDKLKCLARFGLLVSINAVDGSPPHDFFQQMRTLNMRCPALRIFAIHAFDDDPEARRRIMDPVVSLMEQGQLLPVIGARFALSRAADAHRLLESGDYLGRIILTP
jgi:NADPH:quinone reductase